jgi:glycosyltransferase involved in cell wall biosynthesis
MKIYYFHSLYFNFNSSQTIQVIRDYRYLSEKGFDITLSGTYDNKHSFDDIQSYLVGLPINLLASEGGTKISRLLSKLRFLWDALRHSGQRICFVTRSYQKCREILRYRFLFPNALVLMELHEHALPFMLANKKKPEKRSYEKLFDKIDGLILTNYSQEIVLRDEFSTLPEYAILPNGVETGVFSQAKPGTATINGSPKVITYVGQFTQWKNIELIFQAMELLGDEYQLRIAGGKGDEKSKAYIMQLAEKYKVSGQVDYRGFVKPNTVAREVLNGSSVLLLPLGENIESSHFTSPMKLFEYMATGIPVVAVNFPSVNLITGEDTVFLSSTDPEDFASAIRLASCCGDKERIKRMNSIAENYSYKKRAERFAEFIGSFDEG